MTTSMSTSMSMSISAATTKIHTFLLHHQKQIHDTALSIIILTSFSWVAYILLQSLRSRYQQQQKKTTRPSTPDIEKDKKQRKFGGMSTYIPLTYISMNGCLMAA